MKVYCLMGPTASGKTKVAIEIAKHYPVELISVDSAMVYREMDIGTAKPDFPHHLIDIRDVKQTYSVADFCEDSTALIIDIYARNRIPLLVGGTMMYFHSLQFGLSNLPSADLEIRENILKEAEEHGWPYMHQKLEEIDSQAAQKLSINDAQRIQRALEINYITGNTLSENFAQLNTNSNFEFVNFAIVPEDRKLLHMQIARRFNKMLDDGFLDEVKKLIQYQDTPAMRAVGYRQVCDYLLGLIEYEQMNEKAIAATRQLAKRQLTWLRNWPTFIHSHSDPKFILDSLSKSMLNSANH